MPVQKMLTEFDKSLILFDGGENPKKWASYGFPEGHVPNQYVKRCDGGGVNLHIYEMGWYRQCSGCRLQESCKNMGRVSGEQAEG